MDNKTVIVDDVSRRKVYALHCQFAVHYLLHY